MASACFFYHSIASHRNKSEQSPSQSNANEWTSLRSQTPPLTCVFCKVANASWCSGNEASRYSTELEVLSVASAPSEALHKRSLLVQAYLVRQAKQACAEFEDFFQQALCSLRNSHSSSVTSVIVYQLKSLAGLPTLSVAKTCSIQTGDRCQST